jgi:DNA-binding LacI/PurR family transcriptional regulator
VAAFVNPASGAERSVAGRELPAENERLGRARPDGKDRPTIHMVAQRARVSVSTVSRALNEGSVSPGTKRRIDGAIRDLRYSPSVAAQSLVTRRTGCIGVVASSTQSTWFSLILAGIEEQLGSSRHSVLLCSLLSNDRYDSSGVAAWINERRIDGLIFIRNTRREHALVSSALAHGLPVVLVGPDIRASGSAVVRSNNVEAGRIAGEHLVALGHQRIAFAGGPRESLDTRDRHRGLCRALARAERGLHDDDVSFGPRYGAEAGVEYARSFLALPARMRPSAVVLGSDAMALGFMRSVLQHGLKIPGDVSVLGFDGIPEGGLYWPGLTTVLQPARRMGACACLALLEAVHTRDPGRASDMQYAVELVVRESTARFNP